jgi:DNA-binding PadR family transcriptional regulator
MRNIHEEPRHGSRCGEHGGHHHFQHEEHGGYRGWQGRHGRHGGGRGERMERGALRFILLDALREGPKHGYEIIRALEERTQSRYSPSPGIVYPTLQYLNDEGLIESEQQADRRVYKLTETGNAELETQSARIAEFWSRFPSGGASQTMHHEMDFLLDEIEDLKRTIWNGLKTALGGGNPELIRQVRHEVERCQNKIRDIIAGRGTSDSSDTAP